MAFTSGANRVDEAKLAALVGAGAVRRATPEEARTATGFAVGGTPPFGHPERLTCLVDHDLLAWDEIWAAAGHAGLRVPPDPRRPAPRDRGRAVRVRGRLSGGSAQARSAVTIEGARSTTQPRPEESMISLTENAAGKVKELLTEEGRDDIALRIAVQPGGCSGLRYAMYLDDQVTEKDQTEEQFGVRLVIDKMSVPYLSQATIDFVDSLEASGFTIDNPAAQSSCACGSSFH